MKNTKSTAIDLEALWAIRDARGLDMPEKAFLWVLASRGRMFASIQTIAEDMGTSRSTVDRVISSLREKRLITVTPVPGKSNKYGLNVKRLKYPHPRHSDVRQSDAPLRQADVPPTSEGRTTHVTQTYIRRTMKETSEGDSRVTMKRTKPKKTLTRRKPEGSARVDAEKRITQMLTRNRWGIAEGVIVERVLRQCDLEPSSVSKILRTMKRQGIVSSREDGFATTYRLKENL